MNTRPWIRTLSVVALFLAMTVSPAYADHDAVYANNRHSGPVYDYARVLRSEPIIRYVNVTTPVRECWEDVEYYTTDRRPRPVTSTLVGAIIGGVVGNQFGGGSGKAVATVAGTVVGAAIGNDQARRAAYAYHPTRYSRPVRRCETNYTSSREQRIDGYRVIYAYHGRKYETRTPYDPGKKIRIRVDVRPAA